MGDESLDELAAKGRATRLAEDKQKAEWRAKVEADQSDDHRKQAAKRLSPLARNPIRWAFSIPGWVLWGASFMIAFPYFRYFANGGHPVHGSDKMGSKWVLDPHKDGYALFYIFCAVTTLVLLGFLWAILTKRAGARAFAAETAWADKQPFQVLGYPTAVGQDENRYNFEIFFVSSRPPFEQFSDALRGIDDCITAESESYERFRAQYPKDAHPAKNAQRFAKTLHAIVELLVKMQNEHPVDRIEVRG
jgi:hypothetical protein